VAVGWDVEGPIAVEVVPESRLAPNNLSLTLGETSCGLWYVQCNRRELIQLASRTIKVRDAMGAVVGSAQYTIEDESGKKVSSGKADRLGTIVVPTELTGVYKLTIFSAGFTPLEQPVDMVALKPSAWELSVRLNIGGSCSQASLEKNATPQ
jgi:hypothetical protein